MSEVFSTFAFFFSFSNLYLIVINVMAGSSNYNVTETSRFLTMREEQVVMSVRNMAAGTAIKGAIVLLWICH